MSQADYDDLDRRRKLDEHLRRLVDDRAGTPGSESPYDRISDALMNCIGDAVFTALHSPEFAYALAKRGFVLVPVVEPGELPDPDMLWCHDAIDLIGASGDWNDPMSRIDSLYRRAFQAGWDARGAAPHMVQEGPST